jgi:hypothetical protein
MKKLEHSVFVHDKDVYQLLISNLRYAFARDNNLAPYGCISHIKELVPKLGDDFRESTAKQLVEETVTNLKCPELSGARSHRITYDRMCTVVHENGDITHEMMKCKDYVSDYAWQEYKKGLKKGKKPSEDESSRYSDCDIDLSKAEVDSNFAFENEDEWKDLLVFLKDYVPVDWHPYNDAKEELFKPRKSENNETKEK